MAVDRGGLNYPITITLDASGSEQFRAELAANQTAWEEFRAAIKGTSATATELRALAQAALGASAATSEGAAAAGSATRASREHAGALTIEAAAIDRITKAQRERFIQEELAQSGRNRSGSRAKDFDAEVDALQRVVKAQRDANAVRALADKGLDPRARSDEAVALERIAKAEREARIEEALRSQGRTKTGAIAPAALTEEAAALDKIAKAERNARIEEALRLQGRLKSGALAPGPVLGPSAPPPVALTIQQQAQQKFDSSLETLRVRQLTQQLQAASPEFQRISAEMAGAESTAVRLALSIGRLVGVLGLFLAARAVAGGISSLVSGAVEFNAKIETATNTIATLLQAIGQVRNAQGQIVTGAEAFAITSGIAAKQVQGLQLSAAQAGTSFERMVEVLQQATGPGLAAGLNTDQIQRFSVAFSSAATTIGLQTRELSEEVRSLLSGNIKQGQSRVATLLGISPQDIAQISEGVSRVKTVRSDLEKEIEHLQKKKTLSVNEAGKLSSLLNTKLQQDIAKQSDAAKSQGKLFEFLTAKLEAFEKAQPLTSKSFDRLTERASGAAAQLLGAGGVGLFQSLKGLLDDVGSAIIKITDAGTKLAINPQAVVVIKAIADGLAVAVDEARLLLQELSPADFFQSASLLGTTLAAVAKLLAGILIGLVRGVNDVAFVFNAVLGTIRAIAGLVPDLLPSATFERAVALLTEVGVLILAAKAASVLWGIASIGVLTAFEGILSVLALILSPAGLLVGLFVAIAAVANKIKVEVFGIDAPFRRLLDVAVALSIQLFAAFLKVKDTAVNAFEFIGLFIKSMVVQAASDIVSSFTGALSDLIGGLAAAAHELGLEDLAKKLELAQGKVLNAANAALEGNAKVIRATEESAKRVSAELDKKNGETDKNTEKAVSEALDGQSKLSDAIGGSIADIENNIQDAVKKFQEGARKLQDTPPPGSVEDLKNKIATEFNASGGAPVTQLHGNAGTGVALSLDVPATVKANADLANSLLNEVFRPFGEELSNIITNALDPNSKIDVKKRFNDALKGIPFALLQIMFGINPRQSGATGGGIGFAHGGSVPQHAMPSLAHYARGVQGFEAGGPPAGIDSRDRVPIWAQAGEWVMRLAAVQRYGSGTMAAINAGMVDPTSLRALAGTRSVPVRAPRTPSYAMGGVVANSYAGQESATKTAPGGQVVRAVVVPNEQSFERQLAAGPQAMISWLERNSGQVNAALGRR